MSTAVSALKVPSYRHHAGSGQAVVTIDGRDYYLGKYRSAASRREYDRLIHEWLAGGRQLPAAGGTSVAELCSAYWKHAKRYYGSARQDRKNRQVHCVKVAVRLLRTTYGDLLASEFGPRKLKALRQKLLKQKLSRGYINSQVDKIKRIFKWGVAEELVPPEVFHGLQAVEGLRRGRTEAKETEPVGPVDGAVIDATLPEVPEIVADMIRLQRYTGCRPAEVCRVRPCDVDTSGDVWLYKLVEHKTQHCGRGRVVVIGPRAQDVLRPYLLRPAESFCFIPAESEKRRLALRHEARTTPMSCGNRPGTNCKPRRKRKPGDCYTTDSYRRAIHRAVDKINRERTEEAEKIGGKPALLPRWSPNQLRHAAATEVRKRFGLEAAQVTLGHAHARITEVYAERDLALAVRVMAEVG